MCATSAARPLTRSLARTSIVIRIANRVVRAHSLILPASCYTQSAAVECARSLARPLDVAAADAAAAVGSGGGSENDGKRAKRRACGRLRVRATDQVGAPAVNANDDGGGGNGDNQASERANDGAKKASKRASERSRVVRTRFALCLGRRLSFGGLLTARLLFFVFFSPRLNTRARLCSSLPPIRRDARALAFAARSRDFYTASFRCGGNDGERGAARARARILTATTAPPSHTHHTTGSLSIVETGGRAKMCVRACCGAVAERRARSREYARVCAHVSPCLRVRALRYECECENTVDERIIEHILKRIRAQAYNFRVHFVLIAHQN